MPIKDKSQYGPRWKAISYAIRFKRAKGRCESCGAIHGQRFLFSPGKVVLSAAHLNHTPGDNRATNLKALCQRCHLNHDRQDNIRRAKYHRMLLRLSRQPCLFHFGFEEEKKFPRSA